MHFDSCHVYIFYIQLFQKRINIQINIWRNIFYKVCGFLTSSNLIDENNNFTSVIFRIECFDLNYPLFTCLDFWHRLSSIFTWGWVLYDIDMTALLFTIFPFLYCLLWWKHTWNYQCAATWGFFFFFFFFFFSITVFNLLINVYTDQILLVCVWGGGGEGV